MPRDVRFVVSLLGAQWLRGVRSVRKTQRANSGKLSEENSAKTIASTLKNHRNAYLQFERRLCVRRAARERAAGVRLALCWQLTSVWGGGSRVPLRAKLLRRVTAASF